MTFHQVTTNTTITSTTMSVSDIYLISEPYYVSIEGTPVTHDRFYVSFCEYMGRFTMKRLPLSPINRYWALYSYKVVYEIYNKDPNDEKIFYQDENGNIMDKHCNVYHSQLVFSGEFTLVSNNKKSLTKKLLLNPDQRTDFDIIKSIGNKVESHGKKLSKDFMKEYVSFGRKLIEFSITREGNPKLMD